MRALCLSVLLVGCGVVDDEAQGQDEDDPMSKACETDDCVHDGNYTFDDGDVSRRLLVYMPDDVDGAPVLFAWHSLNGSPERLLTFMAIERAVDDGFVVVVPESRGLTSTEWDISSAGSANVDMVLFDVLLDSLLDVQRVDEDRIYATGFSAGGLFTSLLTIHRADRLAATAPFSGGATSNAYRTPVAPIPVMLSWGGSFDSYGGFSFHAATQTLSDALVGDGHTVLMCDHGLGHSVPNDAASRTRAFFAQHAGTGEVLDFDACERR
ncbi:MAG: poly(3-hydroxybutyrate) depolymerase [bacterium]|jgi:poly(3-hydroxybutyrate) depolymerase